MSFHVTKEILVKVEAHAAAGLTKKEIAAALGIHQATLFRKINENSEFSDAIKTGIAKGIATIANSLFVSAKKGNVTAQIFFLKNRSPDQWKDRQYVEETRRNVGLDSEIKIGMSAQEAADNYADTLRRGKGENVIQIKTHKRR